MKTCPSPGTPGTPDIDIEFCLSLPTLSSLGVFVLSNYSRWILREFSAVFGERDIRLPISQSQLEGRLLFCRTLGRL